MFGLSYLNHLDMSFWYEHPLQSNCILQHSPISVWFYLCSYICNCLKMPKKFQISEYSDCCGWCEIVMLLHLQVSLTLYVLPKWTSWDVRGALKNTSSFQRWTPWTGTDKPSMYPTSPKGGVPTSFLHGCLKISNSREQSCYVWVDHNGRVHWEIWKKKKKRQPRCRHRRELWCSCFIFELL